MLTGRVAFEDRDAISVIRKVQRGEFSSPRQVDRRVPAALDAIVVRAMAVEPGARYASPKALAEEIEHWLADEPVQAYREPATVRLIRWARRHRPAVAAAAVVLATMLAGFAVNDGLIRIEKERTEQQRRLAVENFQKADEQRGIAERLSANLTLDRGLALCERGEVNRGLLWLARALETVPAHETQLQQALRANLAGWQRALTSLEGILQHPEGYVVGAAFRPDGKEFLTLHRSGDHKMLTVYRWETSTLRPLAPSRSFADRPSPFNAAQREPLVKRISPDRTVFLPDGKRIVLGGDDKALHQFDAVTGAVIGTSLRHDGKVRAVAYSPDGKAILTGGHDRTARLWDAATGRAVGDPLEVSAPVNAVYFTPDGATFLVGDFAGVVHLHETASRRRLDRTLSHSEAGRIEAIAVSPDGRTIVTGADDCTVRFWDFATGRPLGNPLKNQGSVRAVAFRADGKAAMSAGWDKAVRLWDVATAKSLAPPHFVQSLISDAALSPDGKAVLVGCQDGTARIWDLATAKPISPIFAHDDVVSSVAFRSQGRTLATGSFDGTVRIWKNPAPVSGSIDQTRTWVEVLTRMELSTDGIARILDVPQWEARRKQLEELGGAPVP